VQSGRTAERYLYHQFTASGFISSASNDKTSAGYAVPKTFTEGDLSDWLYSATPYGRKYLALVEQIKPLAVN